MFELYKIYINLLPFCRGLVKKISCDIFRKNINIKKGIRIKSNTEWKLFPGSSFNSGRNVIVSKDVTIKVSNNAILTLGNRVGIGNRCQIVSHKRIEIGDGTILAPNVQIYDHNHVFDAVNGVHQREFIDGEIIIGRHCWLGAGSIILKDVHIGDNVIVGAGSVVTKDIPSNSIAVGTPAKVLKEIDKN